MKDSKGTPRQADEVVPPEVKQAPGASSVWPTVESLAFRQHQIEDDSIMWLAYCKELARRRVPEELFKLIPEDIWRFRVYGSKVVVMRTPEINQVGRIQLAETSKQPSEVGWILTVGPRIHDTAEPNIQGRTYVPSGVDYSDFVPLMAVGDLVLINRHAGQAIVGSLLDEGAVHRSLAQQFLLISIADVFGPLVGVKSSDWSSVQETVMVPSESRLIV